MNKNSGLISVSKLEAAKEQLETAIQLFFNNGSFVPIHTLCSAAYNIIKDISKKHETDFCFELEVRIKPEKIKEWYNKANAAANFFKHADKDPKPNEILEVNEQLNDIKLFLCCCGYKDISGATTPTIDAYLRWMLGFNTSLFNLDENEKRSIECLQDYSGSKSWSRKLKKLVGKSLLEIELNRS